MRELLSQYGKVLLAILGGGVSVGLAVLTFMLMQPLMEQILSNMM